MSILWLYACVMWIIIGLMEHHVYMHAYLMYCVEVITLRV